MSPYLLELEIDAACWEYLAQRIVAHGGSRQPQPVVMLLDCPNYDRPDDAWNEAMRKAVAMFPEPGQESLIERTQRMLERMEG